MDFQALVDSCEMSASVISVEKTDDGHYGDIRVVCANDVYKKAMGERYHDNIIYSELVPKEPNFEDFCYRCAVKKQHLHAYVEIKMLDLWTDGTYIPLSPKVDKGNTCYFLFLTEYTKAPESARMSNISAETAPFVIQTCINLRSSENFSESINTVISDIREKTDAFSSCIILIDKEQQTYTPLCAKFNTEGISIDDFMPYLTPEVVFSWEETLKLHDNVIIKDNFDMEELAKQNPVWVKSLRSADVKTLVLAPLSQGKKLFGVLFITNFNPDRVVEIKEFIELTAFFLSSEIANNELMERLEFMSNVDFLTGVRNRNSMNARVDAHVGKAFLVRAPFGVIFADVNGLKQCNDNDGHGAGDRLLQKAAKLIKKHFEDYEIYRSGGDEFVIFAPGCGKDEFERRITSLRAESGYGAEVSLAIGSDWTSEGDDLHRCMRLADEAMYADKNEFYRQHPDKRR